MPYTLDPNERQPGGRGKNRRTTPEMLRQVNHDYDYPNGLDLRPGHDLHESLKAEVRDRAQEAHRYVSSRHQDWRNVDKNLKAYVFQPERKNHGTGESEDEDDSYDKVIMPVSYAMLETFLTYMTTAFLQQPVFEYEGTGPEDTIGAELLTQVVQKDVTHNALGLQLHTAWRDMFAYGIGVASPVWNQEMGKKTVLENIGFLDRVRNMFQVTGQRRAESEYQVLYEGNDLINIDPYKYLPDPNVAAHEVQDGQFVGWVDRDNYMSLLRQEQAPASDFFNVKYLQEIDGRSFINANLSGRDNDDTEQRTHTNDPVDILSFIHI